MQPEVSRALRVAAAACAYVIAAPVFARALQPSGPEFQVHTYTGCHQDQHEVSSLDDGGFVVVWRGALGGAAGCVQDESGAAVFAQRFDELGARVGTEMLVNEITSGEQQQPVATGTDDGGFVVVWESAHLGEDADDVQARVFDAAGDGGTEFSVNTFTTQDQYGPSVARTTGGFVVAWSSVTDQAPYGGTVARLFDTGGTPAGDEIDLSGSWPSALVADDQGGFLAFISRPAGVEGQRFAPDATPVGDEFLIPDVDDPDVSSSIAPTDAGGFLLVTDNLTGEPDEVAQVWGRRFSPEGTLVGSAFQINESDGPRDPVVARSGNGDYLVAWERTLPGDDQPTARRLSSDGAPAGTEFQLTTNPSFESTAVRVAGLAQGGFAATWERFDGSGSGVYARVLIPGGCADATNDDDITATDALFALRAAVGTATCLPCVCDIDDSGATTATDALAILRIAVGGDVELVCPAC